MSSIQAWIHAARLRTLPLAISGLIAGNLLALYYGTFNIWIAILSVLTALLLQILSNFANDYGDFVKGTDNLYRTGPVRTMQSGVINAKQMRFALGLFITVSFISGLSLIGVSLPGLSWKDGVFFLSLGLTSIAAAIFYTVGKNAYGYRGLGDLFVLLFFGPVAVSGSFYLQYKAIEPMIFLPAAAIGLFSAGVLNMNNLRDKENDAAFGKITIPVRLGLKGAIIYHYFLMLTGLGLAIVFQYFTTGVYTMLYLLPLLIIIPHLIRISIHPVPRILDQQLKVVVLITLLYTVCLGLALFL
ncbi:MAG: 1,4-dihydroxy-2-naphthoate octaprenyltransferase [Flavobacteriales bacterium]|nr:1,4-dihydroxy-2-naphthoate octaprenyltransferase [Flavobacteriales bacterium]